MKYTNEALKRACEIGKYAWTIDFTLEKMLIDPLFWSALGKAEVWEERTYYEISCKAREYQVYEETSEVTWLYQWHQLLDHLAEGKDIESFFKQLLTPRT